MKRFAVAALTLLICAASNAADAPAARPANQFITLGTHGGPVSDRNRSQPANALVVGQSVYLIDAGDGAVQQMARAGLTLAAVRAVFISHIHIDHTGGLFAVLGLRHQMGAKAKVHRVVITHLVAGRDPNIDTAPFVAGVSKWFDGPVEIAADLNRY